MPIFTPAERDATLKRAVALLEGDPRIEAAVITGSTGAGRADRWSDIDLDAIVANGVDCEELTADWVKRTYEEFPVAHRYETAFGSTLVRGFLLTNALLLDMAFTPVADFSAWAPVRVVFDRRGAVTAAAEHPEPWSPTPDWRADAGFAFHDVLHAWSAAQRGRRWQSLYFLQRVRNRTLALSSERLGHDSDEFRHVDDLPSGERDPLLASLVSDLDRDSLLDALDIATRAYLVELRRGDPDLADRLSEPLIALLTSRDADAAPV
jgi:hypothetical protein